jgi:cytochrome c peroxidase
VALLGAACEDDKQKAAKKKAEAEKAAEAEKKADEDAEEPIKPLPKSIDDVDEAKVAIGRRLYFDPILSAADNVSCASCHQLDKGGDDNMVTSTGIDGQKGPINSPTVFNSRYNIDQFWDGRTDDLQEQAEKPVTNPVEMGTEKWENAVERVKKDDWYAKKFKKAYNDDISKKTITHAIAEYEKTLVTPAPFDAYLRGDEDAISKQAKAGYEEFKSVGCTTCHTGINVGGNQYQKMGLVKPYFSELDRELTDADMGRMNVTGDKEDKHVFKVPTLRNVEHTAPYFHDGSVKELEEAVRLMGHHQLGKDLSDGQIDKIVAFLKSLSGEVPDNAKPPEGMKNAVLRPPEAKEDGKGKDEKSAKKPGGKKKG